MNTDLNLLPLDIDNDGKVSTVDFLWSQEVGNDMSFLSLRAGLVDVSGYNTFSALDLIVMINHLLNY